ncbi:MAG TPA: alpha/beta fold hydrolase [Salinimicrobium sp.]|nr:alpha/beta fold hydrolase [Salinimicrobium sp.]
MHSQETSLFHLIKKPKVILEKNPLILLLHGYGSNEEDLFGFANELPDEAFIVSARAPYELQRMSHAWYAIYFDNVNGKFSDDAQAISSREKIVGFLDEIIKEYPVDESNVTLIGFSQGTILSYAVALSYPDKIKNVIALSGYVNEGILKEGFKQNDFSGLSFFCSHGTVDQVIPVDWARKSTEFLKDLNLDFVYKEYPVGHGVAPQNFFDLKNWLQERI